MKRFLAFEEITKTTVVFAVVLMFLASCNSPVRQTENTNRTSKIKKLQ